MPRSTATFDERSKAIIRAAQTNFRYFPSEVQAYERAIEGAAPDEQFRLFALVLSNHKAHRLHRWKNDKPRGVKVIRWTASLDRVHARVRTWCTRVVRKNLSLEDAAHYLWEKLLEHEGLDRQAAFSLILLSALVPYANYEPPEVATEDEYNEARDQIVPQIAQLHCAIRQPSTALEIAAGLADILSQLTDPLERTAFMLEMTSILMRGQQRARDALHEVGIDIDPGGV
jgi:hypothetical protein